MKNKNNNMIGWRVRILFTAALIFTVVSSTEAQNRLRPCGINHYRIWSKLFTNYYQADVCCQCIVSPSFSKPYALYVKYSDTLAVKDPEKTYTMVCDSTMHRRLSLLISHATSTSMFVYDQRGMDGTRYFFFEDRNGATCWSPHGNCGKLVSVIIKVIKAVKTGDDVLLQSQKPTVDSLINVFKSYYPEDYMSARLNLSHVMGNGKDVHDVRLSCYDEAIKMVFTYPTDKYDQTIPDKLKSKYAKTLQQVAKWTFMNTFVIDSGKNINVIIDNSSPFKFQKSGSHYEFTLHEKDIKTNKLIRLFKRYFIDKIS